MRQNIQRREVEQLAQRLQSACDQGRLSSHQYQALHAKFFCYDAAGTAWTVGLHTGAWSQGKNQTWVPGTPPATLQIDEEVVRSLRNVPASSPQTTVPPAAPKAPRSQPGPSTPESHSNATSPNASPAEGSAALGALFLIAVILGVLYLAGAFESPNKNLDRKSIDEVLTTPDSGPTMPPAPHDTPTLGN